MKTKNMKRQGAVVLAVAAALAAGFTPAGAEECYWYGHKCPSDRKGRTLEDLEKISHGGKAEVPVIEGTKAEVVLAPARQAKTALSAEELKRLLAVAESVFKSTPRGGLAIGNNNVHRLRLNGTYLGGDGAPDVSPMSHGANNPRGPLLVIATSQPGDGSLELESITLRRESNVLLHGTHDESVEFTVLPDGRIAKATRGLRDVPLEEQDVQEALRGELDFWLYGDGWRKAVPAQGRASFGAIGAVFAGGAFP